MSRGWNLEDDPGLLPEEQFASGLLPGSVIRPETDKYNWPVDLERLDLYDADRSRIYEDRLEGKIVWKLTDFCQCLMPPSYFRSRHGMYRESEQIWVRRVRFGPIYLAFIEQIAAKKLGKGDLEAHELEGDYFGKPADILAEAKRLDMVKYMPEKMRTMAEALSADPAVDDTHWPTITDAAERIADKVKSLTVEQARARIYRAFKRIREPLKDNHKTGDARKVDPHSLRSFIAEQIKKDVDENDQQWKAPGPTIESHM